MSPLHHATCRQGRGSEKGWSLIGVDYLMIGWWVSWLIASLAVCVGANAHSEIGKKEPCKTLLGMTSVWAEQLASFFQCQLHFYLETKSLWHCSCQRHHTCIPGLGQCSNVCHWESSRCTLTRLTVQVGRTTDSWRNTSRERHGHHDCRPEYWSPLIHMDPQVENSCNNWQLMHVRTNGRFNKKSQRCSSRSRFSTDSTLIHSRWVWFFCVCISMFFVCC